MKIEQNKSVNFDEDDFMWRYVDLHKLFLFLQDKKLFFSRLDNFDDPLEGLTEKILVQLQIIEAIPKNESEFPLSFPEEEKKKSLVERKRNEDYIKSVIEKYQKTQFANCWFVGKKESFAMWNIYSNVNGVAIRYNPTELIDIVIPSAESYNHSDFKKLIYGFVDYVNIWPFNYFEKNKEKIKYTAFKKDQSYVHEKEFRFVVVISPDCKGKYDKFELPLGDISKDNFKIYANPYMESWKFNNLKRLLEKFSMHDNLVKSGLKVKNDNA